MAKTKPADIQVKSIHQIGIAVRDVEKVAQDYWNVLGIGPWKIFTIQNNGERTYRGKPTSFEIKQALKDLGKLIEVETQRCPTPAFLMFDGGDHMEIEPQTTELLGRANRSSRMSN